MNQIDKERLERLKERLTDEKSLSQLSPFERGVEDGIKDALDFHRSDFLEILRLFKRYDNKEVKDFTGEEPELSKIFDSVRTRKKHSKMKIEVNRIEGEEGFDGVFDIVLSEDQLFDPQDEIEGEKRKRYIKGWLGGVFKVYKQININL